MVTKAEPANPNTFTVPPEAPRLSVAPAWQDPRTGALYVHQDLVKVQEPWAVEEHVSPMAVCESFGDVESWVEYVSRYAGSDVLRPFLTWNGRGFAAVLDYATTEGEPGRCQWKATYPFVCSREWLTWTNLANGQAVPQRAAVEKLEDLAESIVDPAPADLMGLLRSLRASVNAKADAELRADGTSSVTFQRDTAVKSGQGSVDLPPFFTIAIPVLKGHVSEDGKPVLYRLKVRVRVSVDESAHLSLRFSIPDAARVLEDVYADRVRLAASLLGSELSLLRAAD